MEPNRQRCRGFTLVETLAATAIVIILLGISAVGLVYYARWLKITELDNAAREIYLAAENRAVLLSGSGRLEKLVEARGRPVAVTLSAGPGEEEAAQGYYIYHSGGSGEADLLPLGSIDPALMDGCFYIVYEPESGSVTDVLYAEDEFGAEDDFQDFYNVVSASARSWRMQMKPMVGYYGGGTAENARDDALGVPIVTIHNEETLWAEITYTVLPSMADKTALDVALTYDSCTVDLSPDPLTLSREDTDHRVRFTCRIKLDALRGKHFSDLFQYETNKPASFGGDFTITAELTAASAMPSRGSDTNNSLFAEGSGGETAYIANLRHLQNLNEETSRAGGKTGAVQIADIDCAAGLEEEYTFTPIQNRALTFYDGGEFVLRSFRAAGDNAGLFDNVAGTEGQPWQFRNIRMVNASAAAQSGSAGALAGEAEDAAFENCQVYWEPEAGEAGLRDVLGDDENGYKYQITGGCAGGLAGQLRGGTIKDCLAATLINGTTVAGGLIGAAEGTVTVNDSYADCYLTGATVGGLAGAADTLALTNCYAAGFIEMKAAEDKGSAAGLCASGNVIGNTVYSVMYYAGAEDSWTPLAPAITGGEYYYLSSAVGVDSCARTYTQMAGEEFAAKLGSSFAEKDRDSHPYNLRTDLALTVYDFPGLAALPHYGDWSAQFVEASLVYYEQYENAYGFYGGNVDALQNERPVKKDGYAIAIRQEGTEKLPKTLTVTYDDKDYSVSTENAPAMTINETTFFLVPLPDDLINTGTAAEKFYQSLSFTADGDNETYRYYYCPHFAKTAVKADGLPPAPDRVSVRTPRHLYMLSLYRAYYNGGYSFNQELDLDYDLYTGYGLFDGNFTQVPIGRIDEPFNGIYNGGCRTIENLVFRPLAGTTRAYAGLFGYSSGTLRDIVYLMDGERPNTVSLGNHNNLYVGGLAGGNSGRVVNCAAAGVCLTGNAYTATIYIGGLVGQNQGEITGCAAECAALAADPSSYAHAYVGGLVGLNENGGIISASYAVGRASSEADATSNARVCGFAGYNRGLIQNSYAAMDLISSGRGVETYGFCGVTAGSQEGTCFLNRGNFTYRGGSYNASYTPRKAREIEYAALTDRSNVPVTGMGFADAGGNDVFPYPTAVRDAGGRRVHYGRWPERMELGVMGVYYWEKLEIEEKAAYHVSLLAVDPNSSTVAKRTTLSDAHNDGGTVTDYGYGYYTQDGSNVSLAASDLYYSVDGGKGGVFSTQTAAEDTAANSALAGLMPGYIFHSYHSFGMEADGGGLYPTGSPDGTFQLAQGEISVSFTVNPHFADALSVSLPKGWPEDESSAPTDAPGSKESNPYEVRAVSQLQNINWNSTNCDTDTVLTSGNGIQFPYLSQSGDTGQYHWLQTHDLKGKSTDPPFSPIAEYYDKTTGSQGTLYGWFGGTYNGDDYVIENINIQGHESSCAGLFGVVYNGTLRSIILYSSDGMGKVASTSGSTQSCWYAIGALAGIAASDSNRNSAVENCAVAGYTVHADMQLISSSWGGAEIGGLVGISNMNLQKCAAVTTVNIPQAAKAGNDNMRVGGLVGASQKAITNCYAGGSIQLGQGIRDQIAGIYIGGIVGGSYFKPLQPQGGTLIGVVGSDTDKPLNQQQNTTNNELHSCYSYVTLPNSGSIEKIRALYALGGTGEIVAAGSGSYNDAANHGVCTNTNCYYLNSVRPAITNGIKTDVNNPNVAALTYAELSGQAGCDRLNNTQTNGPWAPVTSTTDDGFSVAGKYSYPSAENLRGLNYPFPTVLTRTGGYRVHYGDWPLNGIECALGGAPIELDLFANPTHTETLKLTGGVAAGGVWSAASDDESIAGAVCRDGKLTVTGAGVGVTTVTVKYTAGGAEYTLSLSVNVTAVLELRVKDSPVKLFTNDRADVELTAFDRNGSAITAGGPAVAPQVGTYDSTKLEEAQMDGMTLHLTTGGAGGDTTVSIQYTYTFDGTEYTGISAINFQITEPEIRFSGNTAEVVFAGGAISAAEVTGGNPDAAKLTFTSGADRVALDLEEVPPETEVVVEVTLAMDGREHVVAVAVIKPAESG